MVKGFDNVSDEFKVYASLHGATVLSASILGGKGGSKLVFHRGLDIDAALFLTVGFKRANPNMTLLLRQACASGWKAVGAQGLHGRGRKPSFFLRGPEELHRAKPPVKTLTGVQFVQWVTKTCLNYRLSARIRRADL